MRDPAAGNARLHAELDSLRRRVAELENLQRAHEIAGVGTWRWHLPTNRLEWSDRMYRIFGVERASCSGDLGEMVARSVHPDDRAAVEALNRAVAEDLATGPLDYRIVWPDGTIRWVRAEAGALTLDGQGRPVELSGILHDVTDERAREEALRLSEAQFRAFFENVGVGTAQVGADQRFVKVNDRFCDLTGHSRESLIGMLPFELDHPDEKEEDIARLQRLFADPTATYDVEKRFIRKDGRIIWVHVNVTVIRGASGSPLRTVAIVEDITERKRAQAQLLESQQDLAHAQQVAHIGSWRLDRAHEVLRWTDECYRIFGLAPGTPIDRVTFFASVHPEDRALAEGALEPALRGAPYDVEHRIVAAGKVRWIRHRAELGLDDQGRIVMGFGTIQDVTERHELEEQFLQAQKMESIGRLAGGVAHDFNNLLTIISGNAELALTAQKTGEPVFDELSEIKEAARRATELTRNLLAFSRRQIASPRLLELGGVVAGMEKMLRRLIREDIELSVRPRAQVPAVRIDPGQLEQVITNLVVNARDAMPDGGEVHLDISRATLDATYCASRPGLRPGEYVLLTVSDTGSGMTKEVQAHLFEPFFTTKPRGSGTGLGLSTCFGIVKQNGGHIGVHSEPGQGTTVNVYLPAVEEIASQLEAAPAAEPLPTGRELVVVVEDEEGIRQLAERTLSACGYRVLVAGDAEQALALQAIPTDASTLLVTDVVLPGVNGPELATRLTARYPRMRVLFVSGYTEDVIVHHGILEEGINFLQKPFSTGALARKVREVLDR